MRKSSAVAAVAIAALAACAAGSHRTQPEGRMADHAQEIAELRAAYDAFNRGDIEAAVKPLSPEIEWTEPAEFPGGGTYHGVQGAMQYLKQSRAGAAEVISEPERFIVAGDRIVVFVYARVLPKGGGAWQEVRLADVYTFRDGKAVQMRAFSDRQEALRWAGVGDAEP